MGSLFVPLGGGGEGSVIPALLDFWGGGGGLFRAATYPNHFPERRRISLRILFTCQNGTENVDANEEIEDRWKKNLNCYHCFTM